MPATGALYTGVALGTSSQGPTLYAANGAQGRIDVFDSGFNKITLAGNFTDPNLPTGYVPFNVRVINGKVYVTYAPAGRPAQTGATPGQGAIAVFDLDGNSPTGTAGPGEPGSTLAAPWGIALAPADFGKSGGDLLVGNFSFGASEISALDPGRAFLGTIPIATGSATRGRAVVAGLRHGGNNGNPGDAVFHRRAQRRAGRPVRRAHRQRPGAGERRAAGAGPPARGGAGGGATAAAFQLRWKSPANSASSFGSRSEIAQKVMPPWLQRTML